MTWGSFPLFWGPLFPLCIACTSSRLLEGPRRGEEGVCQGEARRGFSCPSVHLAFVFAASRVSIWSRSAGPKSRATDYTRSKCLRAKLQPKIRSQASVYLILS